MNGLILMQKCQCVESWKIRKVYEVSAVNDGAYPQTSINARSLSSLDNEK